MVTGFGDFPTIVQTLSSDARHLFCLAYITLASIDDDGYKCVPASGPLRDGIASMLDGFGIRCILSKKGLLLDPDAFATLNESPDIVSDVRYERIESIEHVASSHAYVYDLTVEHTKNMTLLNGIACRDTFHFAGIGSKNVTLGYS